MFANKFINEKRFLTMAIFITAIIVAAILIYVEYVSREYNTEILGVGDELPSIQLLDLKGQVTAPQVLNADSEPMLINFWASWCKPCINELPLLNEAQSFVPEVKFIAINMKEELQEIQPLIDRYDLTMIMLRDEQLSWKRALAMQSYPVTILVDAQGIIRHIHNGVFTSIEDIIKLARKLEIGIDIS